MEDDDGGFVGYVPSTDQPGPMLLGATILVGLLIWIILPIAVIIGDKYEGLGKREINSDTDEDEGDHTESKPEATVSKNGEEEQQQDNEDAFSVSSKISYYSALSGAMKEVLNNTARPARSGGHKRHRRRHRGQLDRNQILQDPAQYSVEFTNEQHLSGASSQRDDDAQSLQDRKDDAIGIPISIDGGIRDGCHMSESGVSECDVDLKGTPMAETPGFDRNACLSVDGFLDELAAIMALDVEMKRIIKLSIPFATQAIFTGTLDTLTVAVVGKLVGTREVSAFVVVNLLVSLTTQFVGGFHEALATLCSQAIGAKKPRLAGKYVQIAAIFYALSYIPFAVMWALYLGAAIRWFGFDEETVRIGHQYGYLLLADYFFNGLSEAIHGLLDVAGFENYSTFIGALEELSAFLIILIWALVGSPSLLMIGLVQFSMGLLFLILNITIIYWNGWFKPYRSGMIGTGALLDKKAVCLVCKTAMSLSFGYLLTDGEWELLTVFASFLGPAEVAAWGIFGTIWDAINMLVDGIADASEVRCAFLLGSGQPERARLSAYKSLMICVFTSLFITSFLYICGEDLPTWLTNDPALQHLLSDLMPMFGLGNASMVLSTMAWTLLGSQGRYRLATVVVFIVSWIVTLPLAALLSIHMNFSLEGQTAAVVIGYMISGAVHSYFLFRSDWFALSENVMDDNGSRASDDRVDDGMPTAAKAGRFEGTSESTSRAADANDFTMAPQQAMQSERGDLPKPPNLTGNAMIYSLRGLPSPPSGGGDNAGMLCQPIDIKGKWHAYRNTDVEVELLKDSG